jgi:uncharacterized membrane protein HdeD (DUF308 family)
LRAKPRAHEEKAMSLGMLGPVLFIFAGVMIFIQPKLLNYIVAIAFIAYGTVSLLGIL